MKYTKIINELGKIDKVDYNQEFLAMKEAIKLTRNFFMNMI
jgi:hypothetical protein